MLSSCLRAAAGRLSPALLAAGSFAVAAGAAPPPPPGDAGEYEYQVRRGDTLVRIGRLYLRRPGDYREVQAINLVPNPYRLTPGATLRIPLRLARVQPIAARVTAFRGAVTLDGRRPVRVGTLLRERARVRTGGSSSVSFVLPDRSTVTLPSSSVIRIVRLRRVPLSGAVERSFALEAGSSEAQVRPGRSGRDRFEIRTPVSVAAVRGTTFRVALLDGGAAATTSVVEGRVGVVATDGETGVPAGFGVRSDASGSSGPVALLAAPAFVPLARFRTDGTQLFALRPVRGAVRYRLRVSTDSRFGDLRADVRQSAPDFALPPVRMGSYFVRATAIDANDIEGLPTTYRYTYRGPTEAALEARAPSMRLAAR